MIHVTRSKRTPAAFGSKAIELDKKVYRSFFKRNRKSRAQENFPMRGAIGDTPETLAAVGKMFKSKCAACERNLLENEFVCDSWRPRQHAKGMDNEFAGDHYWWLAYEWRNKYLLCHDCDSFKATWFPVEGKRAALLASYTTVIKTEKALLLDPCIDYPEEHLTLEKSGKLLPLSKKGETTIEILKLNRSDLVKNRMLVMRKAEEVTKHLSNIINRDQNNKTTSKTDIVALLEYINDVLSEHPTQQYAMAARQVLLSWMINQPVFTGNNSFKVLVIRPITPRQAIFVRKIYNFLVSLVKTKKAPGYAYQIQRICVPDLSYLGRTADKLLNKNLKQTLLQTSTGSVNPTKTFIHDVDNIRDLLVKNEITNISLTRLYPERIEIKNFKSIAHLRFDFTVPKLVPKWGTPSSVPPKEPWKFLLGENGVGKSSILQAIALVLCGKSYIKKMKLKPAELLKHRTKTGWVKIWFVGREKPATLSFTASTLETDFATAGIPVLGYGSTRVLPKEKQGLVPESATIPVKAMNLFDYSVALSDVSQWLLSIPDSLFDQVAKALKAMLDLPEEGTYFIRHNKQIYFSKHQESLEQLSEGYRSVIALAVDIMKSLTPTADQSNRMKEQTYEVVEGIVLIDEISSHLHPRWQMKIVKSFRKAFPKLQFMVTSHDPLALKGIELGEVLLLKRDPDNTVVGVSDLPDPTSLRAEQLLTSEFFGLSSTLDPELETQFNTYHNLLAKLNLNEEETKLLASLQTELKAKQHLGNSLREEVMYNVIDNSLAKYSAQTGAKNREELFESTKTKVQELWESLYKK